MIEHKEAAASKGERKAFDLFLAALVALVMIAGGVGHLASPDSFSQLVPSWLPANPVLSATGVLQIVIGAAALFPRTRALAGAAFAALCAGYMPLHLWDFVRPDPVFPPPVAATVRVGVQVLFIGAGIALWHRRKT